jgi:hypothetical protein
MEGVVYNCYMIPRKVADAIEKAFGKEKAPVLINALEQGLNSIHQKNREERTLLKAEIKDEITANLVTKDLFEAKMQNLEMKIQTDSKRLENNLIKWVLGLFIAQVAVFVGIVQLLGK